MALAARNHDVVTWLPMTWQQTMVSASVSVRLTLSRRVDGEPGWAASGRRFSAIPERGPEPRPDIGLISATSSPASVLARRTAPGLHVVGGRASNLLGAVAEEGQAASRAPPLRRTCWAKPNRERVRTHADRRTALARRLMRGSAAFTRSVHSAPGSRGPKTPGPA